MTHTIGIVSTVQNITFFTQGYFRTVLTAAGQRTVGGSCVLRLVSLSQDEFRRPESALRLLRDQRCDAALVVAPHEEFLPAILSIFTTLPGIVLSPPHLDLPLSYVCSDNYGAGRAIAAHLAERGHRQVALLQPYPLSGDFWERERGVRAGAEAAGLTLAVHPFEYPVSDIALDRYLLSGHDALIAPSDNDALPLIARAARLGRRVPHDIAVVGFDDEEFAADTSPPLTTVRQPVAEMASLATGYLIDRLAGRRADLLQQVLPNQLIARAST